MLCKLKLSNTVRQCCVDTIQEGEATSCHASPNNGWGILPDLKSSSHGVLTYGVLWCSSMQQPQTTERPKRAKFPQSSLAIDETSYPLLVSCPGCEVFYLAVSRSLHVYKLNYQYITLRHNIPPSSVIPHCMTCTHYAPFTRCHLTLFQDDQPIIPSPLHLHLHS